MLSFMINSIKKSKGQTETSLTPSHSSLGGFHANQSGRTRSDLLFVMTKLCLQGNLSSVLKLSNVVLQASLSQLLLNHTKGAFINKHILFIAEKMNASEYLDKYLKRKQKNNAVNRRGRDELSR